MEEPEVYTFKAPVMTKDLMYLALFKDISKTYLPLMTNIEKKAALNWVREYLNEETTKAIREG